MKSIIAVLTFFLCLSSAHAQSIRVWGADSAYHNQAGAVHFVTALTLLNTSEVDQDYFVGMMGGELRYYLIDRAALGTGLYAAHVWGHRVKDFVEYRSNTYGAGVKLFLHWDVATFDYHSIYVESQAGMVFTFEDFPEFGTPWNFTLGHGIGMRIRLSDKTNLALGYRQMHISNGKGVVPENPACNGDGVYVGFDVLR